MIKLLLISLLCVAVFSSGQAKAKACGKSGGGGSGGGSEGGSGGESGGGSGGESGAGAGGGAGFGAGFNFGAGMGWKGNAGGLVTSAQIRGQRIAAQAMLSPPDRPPPQPERQRQ